MSNHGKMLVM